MCPILCIPRLQGHHSSASSRHNQVPIYLYQVLAVSFSISPPFSVPAKNDSTEMRMRIDENKRKSIFLGQGEIIPFSLPFKNRSIFST
jgi:hypothetical protein